MLKTMLKEDFEIGDRFGISVQVAVPLPDCCKIDRRRHLRQCCDSALKRQHLPRLHTLHSSVFTPDKGHCFLPPDMVKMVCGWDLLLKRTCWWYAGMIWCSALLLVSIVLQIAGAKTATTGSAAVGVVVLISTSVLRGSGISGPEEWQIPSWKRRKDANYGAALQGSMASR
jgi:hypothetical protein